jgi:hypothetical protein
MTLNGSWRRCRRERERARQPKRVRWRKRAIRGPCGAGRDVSGMSPWPRSRARAVSAKPRSAAGHAVLSGRTRISFWILFHVKLSSPPSAIPGDQDQCWRRCAGNPGAHAPRRDHTNAHPVTVYGRGGTAGRPARPPRSTGNRRWTGLTGNRVDSGGEPVDIRLGSRERGHPAHCVVAIVPYVERPVPL